jgi:hypothetical protein
MRSGYTQIFKVDPVLSLPTTTQRIAEEAKLENTPAWLLSTTGGDLIRNTFELSDWGVYHLRSTIRIEKEDKITCLDIHENPSQLHHRMHRSLGRDNEHCDLLDIGGTLGTFGGRLLSGGKSVVVELSEPLVHHHGPKIVKYSFDGETEHSRCFGKTEHSRCIGSTLRAP